MQRSETPHTLDEALAPGTPLHVTSPSGYHIATPAGYKAMTNSRVRVFVAVELPDPVKAEMGKLIAAVDALELRGVRTVRAEGLHLTLRFLGDVDSDVVPSIISAMETAAAESAPFELTLAGTGAFPNTATPRTLWVGMKGDLDRLVTLQRGVQSALETAGFGRSGERFSPHVTIARVRDRASRAQIGRITAALDEANPSPVAFQVDSITLMRSTPQPGGSIFTHLHTAPLGARGTIAS